MMEAHDESQEASEKESLLLPGSSSSNATVGSRNVRDLYVLSISFLFVFLAYGATQNLESSLNSDAGLGSISLGVLYFSLTFFSIGAPVIVKWLGSKYGILLGMSGYWVFMVANLFPSWYSMIPASVFLGFTASLLWVAQGTYITSAAIAHAAEMKLDREGVIGKFNGVFWGFFASHQVIGNLLSLFLLKVDTGSTSTETSSTTWPLLLTFLGSMSIGTFLASFLQSQGYISKSSEAVKESRSFSGLLNATFGMLTQKKMLLLLSLLIYSGLQQAFIWDDFTENIVTPSLGISWIGGVMAAYGAADAICSLLAGRISSGISSVLMLLFTAAVAQLSVLICLAFKQSYENNLEDYVALFGLAIVWGLGDAIFHTQISVLLGTLFPTEMEAAFAQWKIWQSAASGLIFVIMSSTDFLLRLAILLIVLPISVISLSILRYTL